MNRESELDTLFTFLRAERLTVGVAEVSRIHHVLSLDPVVDPGAMAQLVACLVARSPDERDACGRAVALWFRAEEAKLARETAIEASSAPLGAAALDSRPETAFDLLEGGLAGPHAPPTASTVPAADKATQEAHTARRNRLRTVAGVAAGALSMAVFVTLSKLGAWPGGESSWLPRLIVAISGVGVTTGLALTVGRKKWLPERVGIVDRKATLDLRPPPALLAKPALLSAREQQDVVDGLGSYVTEWPTQHLDTRGTTEATAQQAGLPTLRFRSHREVRTVWLWIDDGARDALLERTAFEVHSALRAGGIPIEVALFREIPSRAAMYRARFSEEGELCGPHPRIPEADLGAEADSLVAAILTDGRGLTRVARSSRAKDVTRALNSLRHYSKLAIVDFGRERTDLAHLAEQHRIPCIPPEELAGFLSGESAGRTTANEPRDFAPEHRLQANTAVWAAACALSPRPVDEATALALRDHLTRNTDLRVPPWAIRQLLAASAIPGSIAFRQGDPRRQDVTTLGAGAKPAVEQPDDRARLIEWLWTSEVDGLSEKGTLRTALRFWRQHYADSALDKALLGLWEMPGQTPDRLEESVLTLWEWQNTRPGERACAEVKLHAAHPEGPGPLGDTHGFIVLPWRMSEVAPETWWKLQDLGIGHIGDAPPPVRLRMPGTVALALGLAGSVGASALLGMFGSLLVWLVGIGVSPLLVYWAVRRRQGTDPVVQEEMPEPNVDDATPVREPVRPPELETDPKSKLPFARPGVDVREDTPSKADEPLTPTGAAEDTSAPITPVDHDEQSPQDPAMRPARSASRLLDMVELPEGELWMGSEENDPAAGSDEKPRHRVKVSGFEIGRYAVTQGQYWEVMGKSRGEPKGADLPVNEVSWYDAVEFCNRLSKRERLRAVYVVEGEKVTWEEGAEGYRLPTEAEWEYAARAGTETAWSFGEDESLLGEHAWYRENSKGKVQAVGKKKANRWGLHDMHGNVWEWCWDWFGAYVTSDNDSVSVNPQGPPSGDGRVLRGGSWDDDPWRLRSAYRGWYGPTGRFLLIGFRCVRGVVRQHGR